MFQNTPQYQANNTESSCSILDFSFNSQTTQQQETSNLPNDLWRFFKNDKTQELNPPDSSKTTSTTEVSDWQSKISPSRMKSILEVLEIYEKATSSWATGIETKSRNWFPHPEKTQQITSPRLNKNPLLNKHPASCPIEKKTVDKAESCEDMLDLVRNCHVASVAVFLNQSSRESILERCSVKLSRLSCDHMNLITSPDPQQVLNASIGKSVELTAFGEKCGLVSQVVAVKLPSELSSEKRHAHLTVSYVERISKKSISEAQSHHQTSYSRWTDTLPLTGTIGLRLTNGKKVFSHDEFFLETGVDLREIKQQVEKSERGSEMRPKEEEEEEEDEKHTNSVETMENSPKTAMLSCKEIEEDLMNKKQKQDIIKQGVAKLPSIMSTYGDDGDGKFNANFKAQQASLREKAEEHRKSARLHQKLSFDCLTSAKLAFKEGNWKKGEVMKKASREASVKHRHHDQEAEKLAFEANNLGRINTHTIDLHHLLLPEALARLKQVIDGLTAFVEEVKTTYRLKIITGKGINSLDKTPVLRPAVLQFLEKNALPGQIDESNHGVILTYIKPLS
eukprot:g1866.t1